MCAMRSTDAAWKANSPAVRWRLLRASAKPPTMSRATMLPIAPMLSASEADVREPVRSSRNAISWMRKPVCASRTSTKAIASAQKESVRIAWGSVQRRVCTASLRAAEGGGPAAGTAPSGGRRIWLGSQTSTRKTMGRPTTSVKTAITGVASSSPPEPISQATSGGRMTPAEETPVAEMLMARARRRMNQRAMITFVETPPAMPKAAASAA